MAIITEEEQQLKPSSIPPKTPNPQSSSAFTFWFYFTVSLSLITLVFISLSSLTPLNPKSWFLSLPSSLRLHYSTGRTIKVQTAPDQPSIEVFTFQKGESESGNVLIVHGLGCSSYTFRHIVTSLAKNGVRAVAIDLPGSGFSDKSEVVIEEYVAGGFSKLKEMYSEIKEKGLFWGFDQLVEQGYIEKQIRVSKREVVKPIELGPDEMSRVLTQVIDSLGLAPVDLVLHDSALGLAANWVHENPSSIRSITLLDPLTALPLWLLGVPVIRDVALGFNLVFSRVLERFCLNSVSGFDVEEHRILLKGRNGLESVVEMGKRLNYSLDLGEWSNSDDIKDLPIQLILSEHWKEGGWIADELPRANFVRHSGGRWPKEDKTDEVAKSIHSFISSLPKIVKQAEEEPIPAHIQNMFDEAKSGGHHHHHGDGHDGSHHGDGHGHVHSPDYMNAYGLGQGWAT